VRNCVIISIILFNIKMNNYYFIILFEIFQTYEETKKKTAKNIFIKYYSKKFNKHQNNTILINIQIIHFSFNENKITKNVFSLSILESFWFDYGSMRIILNQSFNSSNFHSLDEEKILTEQYLLKNVHFTLFCDT
jgi:hypothetical protein